MVIDVRSTGDLVRMNRAELVDYLLLLPPPAPEELDDEYLARELSGGDFVSRSVNSLATRFFGLWLGKAFAPIGEGRGRGYNFFIRHNKGIVRRLPMKTNISESTIAASGSSFYVEYSLGGGRFLGSGRDEIRKVSDDIYLGFGYFLNLHDEPGGIYPFLLEGPARAFFAQY